MGLEGAWLHPARLERSATVGAAWALVGWGIVPVGSRGGERGIVEQLSAEARQALVNSGFELSEGGLGMLEAPLVDATEHVVAHICPVMVEIVTAHNASSLRYVHPCYSSGWHAATSHARL